MKATKPEKHLLLPVRSSNIRNHIVNLPATLLLRGGFVIYPRCSRIINSLLHVIILPFVAFRPPLAVFFLFSIRCFSFSVCCFLSIVCRFSSAVFYFMSAFYVCTFAGCSFCFVCFRFSFITNTLFCWKSKEVENFSLLQNKRNCLFGKEKDL